MDAFLPTQDPETLVALGDVPEPQPAADEALVAVEAYSINRGEVLILRGDRRREGWRPGADVAGRIAVAAADGSGPAVGTRVVAHAEQGGWAPRVKVATRAIAALPDAVSTEAAATLGIAALTALRLLRRAGDVAGRRLLITGASGGVGHFFTELAVARGAEVTAVSRRGDRLRELGATVIDAVDAGPYDVAFDSVGGASLPAVAAAVREGGTLIWFGQASGEAPALDFFATMATGFPAAIVPFAYWVTDGTDGADLAALTRLVASGHLHPEIAEVADWAETPRLLRKLAERELTGKAVLRIAS